MAERKKNTTFSIAPRTKEKLKSLSDHSGLSMSAVIDLLVASAEITRPAVQWHVTGVPPINAPCRDN